MSVPFVKSNILAEPRLGGAGNNGGSGGVYLLNPPNHLKMDVYDVVIRATELSSTGSAKDAEKAVDLIDRTIADFENVRRLSGSSRFHDAQTARDMYDAHSGHIALLSDIRRGITENPQNQPK